MKTNFTQKIILLSLLITLFATGSGQAQTIIPNGGFENWSTNTLFSAPEVWLSSAETDGSAMSAERVTDDATDGTQSIRLLTVMENGELSQGLAALGEPADEGVNGISWTQTFTNVHASIKYTIHDGDAGIILCDLFNADTLTATLFYLVTGSSAEWTDIDMPIVYKGAGTPVQPEKMFLAFVSSYPKDIPPELVDDSYDPEAFTATEGSWMSIDNVYFTNGENSDKIYPGNHSFENWYEAVLTDPDSWQSNNSNFLNADVTPVTRSEDAAEGTYSARLEVMNAWGYSEAWLNLGSPDTGIVFTDKPKALMFSYKYVPADGDMGGMNLNFSGTIDGVYSEYFGGTGYPFTKTTEGWVEVFRTLDYDYADNFQPDHMRIHFMAGNKDGSVLYIDNLKFVDVTPTSIIVRNSETGDPVNYAQVSISGFDYYIQLDGNGMADISLPDGEFTYKVAAQGYNTSTGSFTIPADGDSISVQLTPFVPDPEKPVLNITDNDEDKVYFDGDTLSVEIKLPDSYPIPNGLQVNVTQYLYPDGSANPETYTIFREGTMQVSTVTNNTVNVTGIVGVIDKPGIIGFNAKVNIGVEYNIGTYPVIDTYRYNPDLSSYGQAFAGIAIPDDAGITTQPELSKLANLFGFSSDPENDVPIAFVKEGQGHILFNPGLNFIDHRDELNHLKDGMHIMASPETGYYAEISPAWLPFLSNTPATITLENIPDGIPASEIEIMQTNFGVAPDQYSYSYTDGSASIENGAFTFNVYGFSRYSLRHDGLKATKTQMADNNRLQIYPNPAGDFLHVSSQKEVTYLTVSTLSGRTVIEEAGINNQSLDIHALSPGYYMLNITTKDGGNSMLPFIKK
ncbi:T9SS type A sorting domain-containing protein [Saccharicrinis sp. FJH54]|uniref:T9SS type A sorting domain-containing protein n=1 Tax=Saccharicrinis sp. FJH54 TaxID=3344665 RepID=UPI0035D4EBDF